MPHDGDTEHHAPKHTPHTHTHRWMYTRQSGSVPVNPQECQHLSRDTTSHGYEQTTTLFLDIFLQLTAKTNNDYSPLYYKYPLTTNRPRTSKRSEEARTCSDQLRRQTCEAKDLPPPTLSRRPRPRSFHRLLCVRSTICFFSRDFSPFFFQNSENGWWCVAVFFFKFPHIIRFFRAEKKTQNKKKYSVHHGFPLLKSGVAECGVISAAEVVRITPIQSHQKHFQNKQKKKKKHFQTPFKGPPLESIF